MAHLSDSPNRSSTANRQACADCGTEYLSRERKCPVCGSMKSTVTDADVTKKAFGVEDNDLRKA